MSDDEFGDFSDASWTGMNVQAPESAKTEPEKRLPKDPLSVSSAFAATAVAASGDEWFKAESPPPFSIPPGEEVQWPQEKATSSEFNAFAAETNLKESVDPDDTQQLGTTENREVGGAVEPEQTSADEELPTAADDKKGESVDDNDDDFGDFGDFSSSAPGSNFGDFSSAVPDTTAFGNFSSGKAAEFGDFSSSTAGTAFGDFTAASPSPVPAPHSPSPQLSNDQLVKATFGIKTLKLGTFSNIRLLQQPLSLWDGLKTTCNILGERFDLQSSQSGQKMLGVLHVDVHNVLSPGFGGLPIPFFGDSFLSPAWEGGCVQFPQESTLLDFTPAAAQILNPAKGLTQEVANNPVSTGLPDTNTNALLDLEFFTGSPAVPGTPTGQSSSGTLANSDLMALGLFSEDTFSNQAQESMAAGPKQSDNLAKIFESLPQHSKGKDSLSAETKALLETLPDLSFMHAKVLMFPTHFVATEVQSKVN
eukprot:m.153656 g.153656  ORF g.153656 m.153656 type:complete len:477 (+) comp38626_c0_seq1:78-1508(+)